MIPISPDQKREYTDPESGTVYEFRYLTGEHQADFMKLYAKTSGTIEKFIPEARRTVLQGVRGRRPSKQKIEKMVIERATKLAENSISTDETENLEYAQNLVDIFLCGWRGNGLPPFPKDNRPHRYFKTNDLYKMVNVINEMIGDLAGISIEEAKN